jgi:succinate-acetate transporter protein
MKTEYYDPHKPVCDNQADFNYAFRHALKYNSEQNMKRAKPWIYVYLLLWMIFFVWAVLLAMKASTGPDRVIHLVLAVLFSPLYVLSHYLSMSSKG